MRVKFTRLLMREYANGDEIVIAWWDKKWFEKRLGLQLTQNQWAEIVRETQNVLEWSDIPDQLLDAAQTAIDQFEVAQ